MKINVKKCCCLYYHWAGLPNYITLDVLLIYQCIPDACGKIESENTTLFSEFKASPERNPSCDVIWVKSQHQDHLMLASPDSACPY